MNQPSESTEPIVLAIDIDASPSACFEYFVAGFDQWWPTLTHSLSRAAATRCVFEPHEGGRIFETAPDGAEHAWGSVIAFEPGQRVRFSWHPGRDAGSAQWVDVSFISVGRGSRVILTHGGWEALGEIASVLRREYVPGWQHVFGDLFGGYARRRH